MTYKALYRQWRPKTFDDMVEQKHVVKTLKNAVCTDQIGHAYLFSGTRGTGKTSCAQILARAVNCLSPVQGNPCNQCRVCKALLSRTVQDLQEIDAASNNSVDNIRELREEVRYMPQLATYKVYIVDEVHMLSTGAFNALLKTLEEPPEHVIFILATTEPHKLPATVLSRCQRFDFRPITTEGIVLRLKMVVDAHHASIDDNALVLIAKKADGAMRDALSLLDQCLSTGLERMTREDVISLFGGIHDTDVLDVCESVLNYDLTALFEKVNALNDSGKKPSVLLDDLIAAFRNMLIVISVDHPEKLLEISKDTFTRMKKICKHTTPERLADIITRISLLENKIRWASLPKIVLETGLVGLCLETPTSRADESNLDVRIKRLEQRLDRQILFVSKSDKASEKTSSTSKPDKMPPKTHTEETNIKVDEKENKVEDKTEDKPEASPRSSDKKPMKEWDSCKEVVYDQKPSLYHCLEHTQAHTEEDLVVITCSKYNEVIKMQLRREENIRLLEAILEKSMKSKKRVRIEFDDDKEYDHLSDSLRKLQKISESNNIPFEIDET